MNELFHNPEEEKDSSLPPLADRMRPKNIDEVVGQEHLIGVDAPLRYFFETGEFPSIIFWGPPGTGKTTLAYLIAEKSNYDFTRLSAVESGVKDVREVINKAQYLKKQGKKTLLFIDEIHRFNKAQQDAFLHAVEKGIITLIGATTENPSFEVNSALLSRCQVYKLHSLTNDEIKQVVENAVKNDIVLSKIPIEIEDIDFLLNITGGDARTALNAIELALKLRKKRNGKNVINRETLEKALQQKTAQYDKKGESHYDTISAFIKSLRGSDPDAAMLWLAKMLDAGEDPKFIARRMVIFASEDVGNADTYALTLAVSVFQAVNLIGMPECRINLAQGVTYLASCPKSNASYMAIKNAEEDVQNGVPLSVPLHLRNAPTKLMKQEGYGSDYKYPHDFDNHFIEVNYFPEGMKPKTYYKPTEFGKEKQFKEWLSKLWKNRKR
jgi:putative ATPase